MARHRHRSPIFAAAVAQYKAARAEYDNHLHASYTRAEHACHGHLLNARGRKAGIDPMSLFLGNETRAHAYASPELIEHWTRHPRLTWTQFEQQYTTPPEEQAS